MIELSPAFTYSFLLILIRTSGVLVSAPLLSHRAFPAYTKIGFAIMLALVLVPLQGNHLSEPPAALGAIAAAVLREVLFGMGLGLAMNMVFVGLQMASRMIGVQLGYAIGGVIDPVTGADNGTLDQFYAVVVTMVFLSINGHYLVIQALAETIEAVPPGSFDPVTLTSTALAPLLAGLFVTSVRIAMPVIAALFLTDIGMGFVARTMPQVNVLVVGAPIKIAVGMIILGASLPATMQLMHGVIGSTMAGSSQQLLGVH